VRGSTIISLVRGSGEGGMVLAILAISAGYGLILDPAQSLQNWIKTLCLKGFLGK
jgi:hypothetical protein